MLLSCRQIAVLMGIVELIGKVFSVWLIGIVHVWRRVTTRPIGRIHMHRKFVVYIAV